MWSRHVSYHYSFVSRLKITDRPSIHSFHDGPSFVSWECLPNKRIGKGENGERIGKTSHKINTATIETDNMPAFWCYECEEFEWNDRSETDDIFWKGIWPYLLQDTVFWSIHENDRFMWKFLCNHPNHFFPCFHWKWTHGISTKKNQDTFFSLFFYLPLLE